MSTASAIYYDPYDFHIDANPYAIWRRVKQHDGRRGERLRRARAAEVDVRVHATPQGRFT